MRYRVAWVAVVVIVDLSVKKQQTNRVRRMQLQDDETSVRYSAKVLGSERLTPADSKAEVREITFEVEDASFQADVGQSIGVLAPGRREIGQEHHFRLYSIADIPQLGPNGHRCFGICVRRCSYIDEFSGEEYPGIASNYLCDLKPGDELTITGPYEQAFALPADPNAVLILIGAGTGIAPFRAFVKNLYTHHSDFQGRILLFHGAETGLELLYRNQVKDDFSMYYDRDTFDAIDALSKRPGWSDTIDWGTAIASRASELCQLLPELHTHVYLAGLSEIRDQLDEVLAETIGSKDQWDELKSRLVAGGRWVELLY